MARLLPDSDAVVLGALRANLTTPNVRVERLRPDNFLKLLPLVTARVIARPDPGRMRRHRTYAEVDIQSWAPTDEAASDLDDDCLRALTLAAARGQVFAGGRISHIDGALGSEVRDPGQLGRYSRWQAGPRLTIRPA